MFVTYELFGGRYRAFWLAFKCGKDCLASLGGRLWLHISSMSALGLNEH